MSISNAGRPEGTQKQVLFTARKLEPSRNKKEGITCRLAASEGDGTTPVFARYYLKLIFFAGAIWVVTTSRTSTTPRYVSAHCPFHRYNNSVSDPAWRFPTASPQLVRFSHRCSWHCSSHELCQGFAGSGEGRAGHHELERRRAWQECGWGGCGQFFRQQCDRYRQARTSLILV